MAKLLISRRSAARDHAFLSHARSRGALAILLFTLTTSWAGSAAAISRSASASIPAGTVLYVRLKTPVSTATSKVHQKVTAVVERQVFVDGKVVVPLGADLSGEIEKVHSSQNPNDAASMVIHFGQLTLAGAKPVDISCHLAKVENARETVASDGTIQGVLPSSLGSTYIDNALGRLEKQYPGLSGALGGFQKKQVGTPNVAIDYPAGTDMDVKLDKPLAASASFAPAAARQLPPAVTPSVNAVLANAPQRSSTQKGAPGDPLNLVLIGSESQIRAAFEKAGWDIPAARQRNAIAKTVQAVIQGVGDNAAPISNLYLYRRPQDLAFEKVLNTFAMRHHLRLWKAPLQTPDGRQIWLGAAVHDTGYDIHPGVASHATDPHLDEERAKVGADLISVGSVEAGQLVTPPHPLSTGYTGTGGAWDTDGKLLVLDLK
ncbi:MAG: LssY C-terminal domain-containing protein [Terriglobia bacterium]